VRGKKRHLKQHGRERICSLERRIGSPSVTYGKLWTPAEAFTKRRNRAWRFKCGPSEPCSRLRAAESISVIPSPPFASAISCSILRHSRWFTPFHAQSDRIRLQMFGKASALSAPPREPKSALRPGKRRYTPIHALKHTTPPPTNQATSSSLSPRERAGVRGKSGQELTRVTRIIEIRPLQSAPLVPSLRPKKENRYV